MNNKSILVTGAGGFVGRHLIKSLIERGYQVFALVRQNTDTSTLKEVGVSMIFGDLRVEGAVQLPDGIETIVHLASTMKGPWEEYLESTVRGTERLLQAAAHKNVKRFIYMSSISVYETLSVKSATITEDSPLIKKDLSLYERSKIEAEKVVEEFIKKGMNCLILRSGVIYGPGGTLFPSRLGLSLGAKRFWLIGSGKNRIPLVYIENLVEAILKSIQIDMSIIASPEGAKQSLVEIASSPNEKLGAPRNDVVFKHIFNIVDDQNISQNDYLAAIKNSVCPDLSIVRNSYPVAAGVSALLGLLLKLIKKANPFRKIYLNICVKQLNYSNEKAKIIFGWRPPVSGPDALKKTMTWFNEKVRVPKDADLKLARATIELKNPVHVGIVGCGVIAKTHLDILKKITNARIVGLCDSNQDMAAQMARDYGGIKTYRDLETMLTNEKIDIVHILTPPQSHKDLTIQAARHKCHVFVEKPMAVNAAEARTMVEAAQTNDIKLCVGHNHVFDPPMVAARRLVHQGALGQILYAESWYGFNLGENLASRYMIPGAEKHWAMTLPGKLYQNLISHPISVLTDVLGYPDEIHAMASSANLVKAMNTDELKVMMKCKEKVGLLTVSLAVNPRYQFLNIYGTNMCIFVDFLNKTLTKHATLKMVPKPIARAMFNLSTAKVLIFSTIGSFFKVLTRKFTYFDGIEILIKQFYKSVTDGTEIPISGEDGLRSMEVMDEIWRQIEKK